MRKIWFAACAVPLALAGCTTDSHPPSAGAVGTVNKADCGISNVLSLPDRLGFQTAPRYIGLITARGQALAKESGLEFRVVGQDGHCVVVTADARQDRVNVYVVHGRIDAAAIY